MTNRKPDKPREFTQPYCKSKTCRANCCALTYPGANAPMIEKLSTTKIVVESFCFSVTGLQIPQIGAY
jgi:hypothetical protein